MINWIAIATTAVSIITPLVKKAGEEFAGKTGEEIFSLIKRKFKGDKEAESALSDFEKKPERYRSALADIVREKAETDSAFGQLLLKLVESVKEQHGVTLIARGTGIAQATDSSTASVFIGSVNQSPREN